MSSPAHSRRARPDNRRHPRGGFTLIELIVAVAIIVLLIGIALPVISASFKQAKRTRAAADLQSISTGLEAYRTDFGDYPRVEQNNVGFAVLTKALISPGPGGGPLPGLPPTPPYPAGIFTSNGTPGSSGYVEYVAFAAPDPAGGFATSAAVGDNTKWAVFYVSDGKDGAGFRARPGGKPYGPYLQPEKFRLRGLAILDAWDNPVLYFPARPAKPAPAANGVWPLVQPNGAALYNANHNLTFFTRHNDTLPANALKRMEALLVRDTNNYNGQMDTGEEAATTLPFLLWMAGPDQVFGPTYDIAANPTKEDIRKVDDITNYTTGQ